MESGSPILWLMFFTLAVVIVVGVYQFIRVQRSKTKQSHSAMTEDAPSQRVHDGAQPGVSKP